MADNRFVVCKSRDFATINRHYAECVKRVVPHIVVERRTRWAELTWDHITLNSELDAILIEHTDEIIERIRTAARDRSATRISGDWGALVGRLPKIDFETATLLAGDIFDILATYLPASTATSQS
jgi:hypothetical protein